MLLSRRPASTGPRRPPSMYCQIVAQHVVDVAGARVSWQEQSRSPRNVRCVACDEGVGPRA